MTTALVEVSRQLTERQPHFAELLPDHVQPQRVVRCAIEACRTNTSLLNADRESLMRSVITACYLGLEPDGILGLSALVPFKGKVQLIPMVRGLTTLAAHSTFMARGVVVAERDSFSYQEGSEPKIWHAPPGLDQDRGKIIGAYATAHSDRVGYSQHVMNLREILDIRNASAGYRYAVEKGKQDNPWIKFPKPMVRKTPLRALASQLPITVDKRLLSAARMDEIHDQGHEVNIREDGDLVVDGEYTIRENELS